MVSNMKMLAIYDISDPKRLSKVARIMKDYGVRVQKSKFEIDPTPQAFMELKKRIAMVINEEEDGVKYMPLCHMCQAKTEILGLGRFIDPDKEFIVC